MFISIRWITWKGFQESQSSVSDRYNAGPYYYGPLRTMFRPRCGLLTLLYRLKTTPKCFRTLWTVVILRCIMAFDMSHELSFCEKHFTTFRTLAAIYMLCFKMKSFRIPQFFIKCYNCGPRLKSFLIFKTHLPFYIKWRQRLLHSPLINSFNQFKNGPTKLIMNFHTCRLNRITNWFLLW